MPGDPGINRFLTFLTSRELLAGTGPGEPSPLEALMASFREWMVRERGLAAGTVIRYERTAGRFLGEPALLGKSWMCQG